MIKIKITKEFELFKETCPICRRKSITGISEIQLNSRMKLHQTSKECMSYISYKK